MTSIRSVRTLIGASALSLGVLALPALVAAAPPSAAVHTAFNHVAVSAATVTAATPKSSTAPAAPTPATGTYRVVAGTYKTQSKADKRLAAISAKGITGFSVVTVGTKHIRYVVEQTGLTKVDAKALWKQLRRAHFKAFYTAH